MSQPRLIVSDIDGTLLNSKERVSPRLREAVRRLTASGTIFTLASGRPARWMLPVLEQLPIRPLCICANGAVTYDSARDEIVRAKTLSPEDMRSIVETSLEHTQHLPTHLPEYLFGRQSGPHIPAGPGLGFGVERAGVSAFDRAEELYVVEPDFTHAWESEEHLICPVEEVISQPAVKLLGRNPNVTSRQIYDALVDHIDPALSHMSYSWGGGLVEFSAPGVTKRSAIEDLISHLNERAAPGMEPIRREDVVVFGDMPNDLEMIEWAGLGVAMGNAEDQVKAAADVVTTTNDDDGVAEVLQRWL
ncbi:HAD family hydrolase [Corynebacterium sp.]|uniref:HAD family hydrolase n=1 Tax=Corynebacterium sp. TaxID=1720 RepID=UPI0026039508|nr:HAD family hydrolase [Corynebacterium sp.]